MNSTTSLGDPRLLREQTIGQGWTGWTELYNGAEVTTNGFEMQLRAVSQAFDLYVHGGFYPNQKLAISSTFASPLTFVEIAARGWTVGQFADIEMLEFAGLGTFWQVEGTPEVIEVTGRAVTTPIEGFPEITSFLGNVFSFGTSSTTWGSWSAPTPVDEEPESASLVAGVAAVTSPQRSQRSGAGRPASRAFHTFKGLVPQLGMTDAELAEIVQVGRTTVYNSWGRGSDPRPSTARRLYELNATIDAVRRRVGGDALLSWLARGAPSPRELLEAHDLEEFNRRADELIFRRPAPAEDIGVAWLAPEQDEEPTPRGSAPRRRSAGVRSRRVTR